MTFYGRTKELNTLRDAINSGKYHCFFVTGRRGMGKTAMLTQLMKGTRAGIVYFQCLDASAEQNALALEAAPDGLDIFKDHAPRTVRAPSIQDLFYLLFQLYSDNLILMLDDYGNLRKAMPEVDQLLRDAIDHCFGRRKYIIICDEDPELIDALCGKSGAFRKAASAPVHLQTMDYVDAALFYPDHLSEEKLRLYAAFGGRPAFVRLVDPALSARENIIRQFIAPDAVTGSIIESLLKDVANTAYAQSVLYAVASGKSAFADILAASHLPSAPTLSDTLNGLLRLELIRRDTPINDPDNSKRSRYTIKDPAVAFWYRYIFIRQGLRYRMSAEDFYDHYIAGDFEHQYLPQIFTDVCRQYAVRIYGADGAEAERQIGRYSFYDRHAKKLHEAPVVAMFDGKAAAYCPVCSTEPLTNREIEAELGRIKEKVRLYCDWHCFISYAGFADDAPCRRVQKITVAELYSV